MPAPRLVQSGSADPRRPLIVGFLIGSRLDPRLRELFGPDPCIVAWESFGAPEPGAQFVLAYRAAAKAAGWSGDGPVILIGWSLGCSRIRAVLPALKASGATPLAVLCLDGTTATWPTPAPGQRDVWEELVRAARAGETTAILTCTGMTYVEHLQSDPFWATVDMLRAVTGWPLAGVGTPFAPEDGLVEDGQLHVARFGSPADASAAAKQAHEDQENVVLFWAARRWLVPLLGGLSPAAATLPPPPEPSPAPGASGSLGQRALALALGELAAGVAEVPPGSNSGPRVREYLAGCERGGKALGLTAGAWCASFASWCAYGAAWPGELPPHGYRASVAELFRDAVASGHARPASATPAIGWLALFARLGANPLLGGQGHVGRVESLRTTEPNESRDPYEQVVSVDGNVGDRVSRATRARSEVLAWIAYDEAPVQHDETTLGRLWAIADQLEAGVADGAALDLAEA